MAFAFLRNENISTIRVSAAGAALSSRNMDKPEKLV
jgi:hypothetical protein